MSYVHYEKLDCYQLAFDVALEVHKLSLDFPKFEQYGGLAEQLRRSSKSICANIAEGLSKHMSLADERKFLSIAMGSAEESRVWIGFAQRLSYVDNQIGEDLRHKFTRIGQMIYGLYEKRKVAA